jgi:hypothetical protein
MVWVIGLVLALLVAFSESGAGVKSWPTSNQSLYGFHESIRMIISMVAFLMAANAVARDLPKTRRQILFTRPFPMWFLTLCKLTSSLLFSIGLVLVLMGLTLLQPCLSGHAFPHNPKVFLITLTYMSIPSLFYITGLGIFLTVLTRRVILSIPIFLAYLAYVLVYAGHHWEPVLLRDFTMRMNPTRVGVKLHSVLYGPNDLSFAQYFNPINPQLLERVGLYFAISLGLILAGSIIMEKRRKA